MFDILDLLWLLRYGKSTITLYCNNESSQWMGRETNDTTPYDSPDADSYRYAGKLRDGKPTGRGILIILTPGSMTVYRGGWRDGRFHGRGRLKSVFSSHSREYSGTFKDGLKHGYGRETWLGGKYKGEYENGEMCGEPTTDW